VPVLGHRLWLTGSLGWSEFRRCQKIENPLERDWAFKEVVGFPEETRTRVSGLLRLA